MGIQPDHPVIRKAFETHRGGNRQHQLRKDHTRIDGITAEQLNNSINTGVDAVITFYEEFYRSFGYDDIEHIGQVNGIARAIRLALKELHDIEHDSKRNGATSVHGAQVHELTEKLVDLGFSSQELQSFIDTPQSTLDAMHALHSELTDRSLTNEHIIAATQDPKLMDQVADLIANHSSIQH